ESEMLRGDSHEQHPAVTVAARHVSGARDVVDVGHVTGDGASDSAIAGLVLRAAVQGEAQLGAWPVVPDALDVAVVAVVTAGDECAVGGRPLGSGRYRRERGRPGERLRPRRAVVVVDPRQERTTFPTHAVRPGTVVAGLG